MSPCENGQTDDIDLTSVRTETVLSMRLSGGLDRFNARTCIDALLDSGSRVPVPSLIVLDLRQLTLLTAAGIRMLLIFADMSALRGTQVRVALNPDNLWWQMVRLVDTDRKLPLFATPEEAFSA